MNRELSFCASQVMKRNCTGLWTVLFCTEESILWMCILLRFCSDALCQKIGSHPVLWGRGPRTWTQRQVCIQGISTAVRSAGPCNMGADLGAGREVPGQDPLQTPRAVILSFEILCFIKISFSYHKTFSKVITNLISWSQLSPYWTGDRANVQTGQNDTGESSSCLETNRHNWGRRK